MPAPLALGLLRGLVTLPTNARVEFAGKTLTAERGHELSTPGASARIVPGVGALSTIRDDAAHRELRRLEMLFCPARKGVSALLHVDGYELSKSLRLADHVMILDMNDHPHLAGPERGCLVLLWILSPIVALAVWGFLKLVLFFKWAINEDLRGRYDGVAPLSAWLIAWWETAWLLIVVGVVGFLILAPLYGWAWSASIRWFKSRQSSR